MNLGFIGLGRLGHPVALNLLEQNKQLYIYNRTASKMEALVAKGATACGSVKELASKCDIVFTLVSDDAAINDITLNEDGIAANLKSGGIHVSISTISPTVSEKLAEHHTSLNQYYIAAPVMGRPTAAEARKLNFLVSGNANAVQKIKPYLLQAGGEAIWEFGENASLANVVKLCNNFLIISAIESMAEAMRLAEKSGVDKQQWINMITNSLFSAPIYRTYSELLLNETYLPAQFYLKHGLKDINLALQQAAKVETAMPVGEQLKNQMNTSIAKGYGEYDQTAIALALEEVKAKK
jgi:3-hydroxyisobutyrate dehydrogenase-like beta-hydroxyacid dehydrogenase